MGDRGDRVFVEAHLEYKGPERTCHAGSLGNQIGIIPVVLVEFALFTLTVFLVFVVLRGVRHRIPEGGQIGQTQAAILTGAVLVDDALEKVPFDSDGGCRPRLGRVAARRVYKD